MPIRALARRAHLAPRAQVLVLIGVAWAAYGASVIVAPDRLGSLAPHEHVPAGVRGVAWVVTGAVALAVAFRSRHSTCDHWGFTALVIMPLTRMVSHLLDFAFWALPGWPDGSPRGWAPAIVWAVVTDLIIVIGASLPPEPLVRRR